MTKLKRGRRQACEVKTGLWHWQDDVELTAFLDHRDRVLVLFWPDTGLPVYKNDLQRGDHIFFNDDGYVTELWRPSQRKLWQPSPAKLPSPRRRLGYG